MFSPLEQYEIYHIGSLHITVTNVIWYMILAVSLLVLIGMMSRHELVPTSQGIIQESMYHTMEKMVENHLGHTNMVYQPLIYTLFYMIFFLNILGMLPYTSTPTAELILTLTLSVSLLLGILLIGIQTQNQYIIAVFIPAGTPLALVPLMIVLELFAYITRAISLGLRLGVNLITGHILVKVCVAFLWSGYLHSSSLLSLLFLSLPIVLLIAFISLEILIAYLQSFIFTFITCLTLRDVT